MDRKYFYAGDGKGVSVSSGSGKAFTLASNVTSYGVGKLAVHPVKAGDVWYSTSTGTYLSTDFGEDSIGSSSVQSDQDIAVGKGTGNTTNVYAFNTIDNVVALRLIADEGKT